MHKRSRFFLKVILILMKMVAGNQNLAHRRDGSQARSLNSLNVKEEKFLG